MTERDQPHTPEDPAPPNSGVFAAVTLLVIGALAALTGATELVAAVIVTAVVGLLVEGARRLRGSD